MSVPVKHDGMMGFIPVDQQGPVIPPYYDIVTGIVDNHCWHSTANGWGRVNRRQSASLYDLVIRRRFDAPSIVPNDPNQFGWNKGEAHGENEMLALREDVSLVKQMLMQLGGAATPALPAPAVEQLTAQMKQLTDVFQGFVPLFTALVGRMQEQASRLDKQTLKELKAFQKRLDEYKEVGWVSSPLTHEEVSWIMKIINKFR